MDNAASVLAKLQNSAKESGRSYQLCLQLFCQEEFIRRLALSRYADFLILKGGLFIYTLSKFQSRTTIDVDFLLRRGNNSKEEITAMITEILSCDSGNDFVLYEIRGTSDIALQRKYSGVSVQLIAKIKNTRTPITIDIGIDDIIIPKPEKRIIPSQLTGFSQPEVYTYTLESTIAEKFDAILQRLELTSRMKDFFDIFYCANMYTFDGVVLKKAIEATLNNRNTAYDAESFEKITAFIHNEDMTKKWRLFQRKLKLTAPDFQSAITMLDTFLHPVFDAILASKPFIKRWDATTHQWKDDLRYCGKNFI